ncbi:odorant receptor 22c-like isoform X1 [Bombus bifarius]|nr:odorant receptor 22c-like isoform X1 [Bombus vancouverensis nearcticus]XP_033302484.1 odorant receptor 22c-like [Bombus bifarius]XP_033314113.1 odorant receptor 22c-like isoform X1 [Bombus bifarius]
MVLFSIIISTLVLTFGGIILIVNSPLLLKLQFVIVSLTVLTEVFMYAWPADHLREMSANVSRSAYNLIWYKQTLEIQKNLLNVLVFQEPVTLSVSCVLPELSLRYYCSYLSNAMSIFTALRAAIGDNST